ncbi:MAG: tetratricopeptide repeat protein [Flavihumibacter sp.]|nr:tetratricopeptide repeat protein [Flavihumibacter sp.]
MNKSKMCLLVATAILGAVNLLAQSVDQGKRFFYAQRLKSAKDQFEKLIAANPNNIDAVYWLGQTEIELKNPAGAKALYQKTLATNGSAPLALIGMGHVELIDGKKDDARQRFETAISLTKSKDINVFNAVAQANIDAKDGDATYAIEKLNLATQVKNFNNAETWMLMGDAYRKLIDGGGAVQSYQKALTADPKLAAAKYKIGKIYLTQKNYEYALPAFEEATQLDAAYAPAYYELFYYYYFRDIDKAAGYFDKYLANTDPGPTSEYDRISILYARKKYADCIAASTQKVNAEGDNADKRYYKLIAYSYFDQQDSVNAKNWLDQYFAKQKPDAFSPNDYEFRAQVLSKFPGNEAEALRHYDLAVNADTSYDGKMELMTKAADFAKKIGVKIEQANWLGRIYNFKKNASKTDLYNWALAHYQGSSFVTSDSLFTVYSTKYPDEIFGYLWAARSLSRVDTSMEMGIAVPKYIKLIDVAKRLDSSKYKSQIIESAGYLAGYSNNIKKDKQAAIDYLQQILYVDPTNADAQKNIEIIRNSLNKPAAKPAAPAAKPKTTGGTKSTGKAPVKKKDREILV